MFFPPVHYLEQVLLSKNDNIKGERELKVSLAHQTRVRSCLDSPSSLPVQLACRHLTTASLYLSQPSDLCVNGRHRQLTLNPACISSSARQTVSGCISRRL